jgi:hypothetical protein
LSCSHRRARCFFCRAARWKRPARRSCSALLAMLCKEEAVMLPPLFVRALIAGRTGAATLRGALLSTWPVWVAAAIYGVRACARAARSVYPTRPITTA